eukprot:11196019-Lingulodinium_polyedra.AAC.1
MDGRWHVAVVAHPAGVAGQRFRTWLVQVDGVDVRLHRPVGSRRWSDELVPEGPLFLAPRRDIGE